jgi:hypothetical protein
MDLGPDAAEQWRDEIDQLAILGGILGELVFFYKASKTLILTDTIINRELDKIAQPWRLATRLTGMYYPHNQLFFGMHLPLLFQKKKLRAAVESPNASSLAADGASPRMALQRSSVSIGYSLWKPLNEFKLRASHWHRGWAVRACLEVARCGALLTPSIGHDDVPHRRSSRAPMRNECRTP